MHEDKDTGEDIESQANDNQQYIGETVLKEININLKNNEKVAIIGKVGSGKTSLFLTILKEICIAKGKVEVSCRSHIAYAE